MHYWNYFLIPFSQTKITYFIYLRKREDVAFMNTRIYSGTDVNRSPIIQKII